MDTKIAKWGNSIGVRLPKSIADQAALKAGDRVTISIRGDGNVVLTPRRSKLTLDELLKRMTEKNRHGEVDWAGGVGEEAW